MVQYKCVRGPRWIITSKTVVHISWLPTLEIMPGVFFFNYSVSSPQRQLFDLKYLCCAFLKSRDAVGSTRTITGNHHSVRRTSLSNVQNRKPSRSSKKSRMSSGSSPSSQPLGPSQDTQLIPPGQQVRAEPTAQSLSQVRETPLAVMATVADARGGGLFSPKSYVDVPAGSQKSDYLYTIFLLNFPPSRKSAPKGRHMYVYHVNVRTPPRELTSFL